MPVHSSVLDLIGDTPIVDVSVLSPNPSVRLLAKLEGQNPAGSVKDRIALAMVSEAEVFFADSPQAPSAASAGAAPGSVCQCAQCTHVARPFTPPKQPRWGGRL